MGAKVFIVDYESQANYKVFFCNYQSEERNQQIIQGGVLVKYSSQSDVKVYIVKYSNQADILIMRKNFPR
ncbi:MAG: hypothetical protein IPK88_04325 [Saprospiraceae bacterium]|jgi:hypothetical protein|nr:hypothetical protein [Candidatus Defluviibacterium haderslevense]MBK7245731.1 hypothetical protein [Candidatus Defluviibacterium haderslevense]MBK8241810.1 hypothetical protein [Candidatus Defluviibacterium haderslevense]MBK8242630.1 hypothetical protein [Candidatus Defluviibacterium haderslevense]